MTGIDTQAQTLFIAGVRDEASIGWQAAEAWLDRGEEFGAIVSYRDDKAADFLRDMNQSFDGRIIPTQIEWTDAEASRNVSELVSATVGPEHQLAGAVHSIAGAPKETFSQGVLACDPIHTLNAFDISTLSYMRMVQGVAPHIRPGGGIVTFGFGEVGHYVEGYGSGMATAKAALTQMVVEVGAELGAEAHRIRTVEITPGYVPTRSGKGVALANRARPKEVMSRFEEITPLAGSTGTQQAQSAGRMAVEFMLNPAFAHTTMETIKVDGGWHASGNSIS